jgi:hypothetical protein
MAQKRTQWVDQDNQQSGFFKLKTLIKMVGYRSALID